MVSGKQIKRPMAKQSNSYLGGFSGRLGPAVGYMWNGKWCLRSRPAQVRNPRSDKQLASRALFAQAVQLAARFARAVNLGLTAPARAEGMTAYNLFVRLNQQAFSLDEGALEVDYTQLALSMGPVAPVAFDSLSTEAGNVLRATFEKNPLHLSSKHYDAVYLYVYCPANQQGFLTLPVNRREERVGVVLPTYFAGREVHVYGFVQDDLGRCSASQYVGSVVVGTTADGAAEHGEIQVVAPSATATAEAAAEPAADVAGPAADAAAPAVDDTRRRDSRAAAPPDPPDPNQLSLW